MTVAPAIQDWADLRQRLMDAEDKLRALANEAWSDPSNSAERTRLLAKKEGVSLALSYMRDYPTDELCNGSTSEGNS